jgi:hypothetical protein
MRRDGPARGKVASRRCKAGASPPGEQRPEEQDRSPETTDERRVRLVLADLPTANAQRRRPHALNRRTEIHEQANHDLDVADSRDVAEHAFFRREQAGGQQRERAVLVAFDVH